MASSGRGCPIHEASPAKPDPPSAAKPDPPPAAKPDPPAAAPRRSAVAPASSAADPGDIELSERDPEVDYSATYNYRDSEEFSFDAHKATQAKGAPEAKPGEEHPPQPGSGDEAMTMRQDRNLTLGCDQEDEVLEARPGDSQV